MSAKGPASGLRAGSAVVSLGLANAVSLASAVCASAVYAAWLSDEVFGQWAMALTAARCCVLLLDGGIKTALVRRHAEPDAATQRGVQRWCAGMAGLLIAVLGLALPLLVHGGGLSTSAALLLWSYPAVCLLAHVRLPVPLARLERAQRFDVVGRAEGLAVTVEFLLPLAWLAAGAPAWVAFPVSALVARSLRTAWVVNAARGDAFPLAAAGGGTDGGRVALRRLLWGEGAGLQAVALLSLLRDSMHLWLLAPWFGSGWAGHYALALTACALASQVAAATASRVLLPALRGTSAAAQWLLVLARTRQLAVCTLPLVALVPGALAWVDAGLWSGRWHEAVAIAPWLALRMVGGTAATVVGAWLLVVRSPWHSAAAHAAWTLSDLALAAVALAVAGPEGLAWALAIGVWPGLAWLLRAATPAVGWQQRARLAWMLLKVVLERPSAWAALALAAVLHLYPGWTLWALPCVPLCWLAEAGFRRRLHPLWAGMRQRAFLWKFFMDRRAAPGP
jgi:O-antigen/teichoic acid export membrane protein